MPPTRSAVVRPRSFNCPKCGSGVEVHFPGRARAVVCGSCMSILDTSTPEVALLQEYASKMKRTPCIPLGTRAQFDGIPCEVVGFMVRGGRSEGYAFSWDEYLLYNPFLGYRFLAETKTGWQVTAMTNRIPPPPDEFYRGVVLDGARYRFSEVYDASVRFVLGEFYWQVQVGESVRCYDFKRGKRMIMAEAMPEEYTWAAGREVDAREVWEAFRLEGPPRSYDKPDRESSGGPEQVPPIVVAAFVIFVILILAFGLGAGGSGGSGGSSGGFFGGK